MKKNELRQIDQSVIRKNKYVEGKEDIRTIDKFPLFTLVEFNVFGSCNRDCEFCPVSDPNVYTSKNKGIDLKLYKKIVLDLANIDYSGTLLFSGFSEPFLNKQLTDLCKLTKKHLPSCKLECVTNGDVFKNKTEKLLEVLDSGMDTVNISIYDGPEAMDEFVEMKDKLNLSDSQLFLRRRYFDKDKSDYGMIISNRTNIIDSNKYRSEYDKTVTELPLKRRCYYPFYMMLIDYNGDLVLCPHDWGKKMVIGNVGEETIWNLWKSEYYNNARKMLADKNRNFTPCNICDVHGDVIGERNYKAWLESNS